MGRSEYPAMIYQNSTAFVVAKYSKELRFSKMSYEGNL